MARFTPEFLDELKSRLRPSDVIGRYVKLRKQGNEWAGLSPFTKEKTPSFFVNDQKGFYHCFSSGKHGDVIRFLTETQGFSFHEAVAKLAGEANLALPEERPGEEERARKRKGLAEACEAAAAYYSALLRRADGRPGAEYLRRRGLTPEQTERFRLGYAPEGRASLKDYLINKGYTEETLVEAGLVIKPEDGGETYDRFRGRVMFPILDANGAVIAFGGRALDPNARAKYLNSPETALFHKSEVLYNYGAARREADSSALLVCEGYLDVIAAWGAGYRRAVAPLGTALTEAQLLLLWRLADEPVLCFDGDRAGIGAAHRAIDRTLPLLKPGKSLRFAFLPDGQDPDDLIRSRGAEAFRLIVDAAQPLAEVLWRRESESRPLDTPEKRAALTSHLRAMVKTIPDKDVRTEYGIEFARRLRQRAVETNPRARAPWRKRSQGRIQEARARAAGNPFASPAGMTGALSRRATPTSWMREATLVLAAIRHPALIELLEETFFTLTLEDRALKELLSEVFSAISANPSLDTAQLHRHLQQTKAAETLERVLGDETLNRQTFLRPEAELEEVERGWSAVHRHHVFVRQAQLEVAESAASSFSGGDSLWKAAVTAREELKNAGETGDRSEKDDGVSRSDFLSRLERLGASVKDKTGR